MEPQVQVADECTTIKAGDYVNCNGQVGRVLGRNKHPLEEILSLVDRMKGKTVLVTKEFGGPVVGQAVNFRQDGLAMVADLQVTEGDAFDGRLAGGPICTPIQDSLTFDHLVAEYAARARREMPTLPL